jgi:hypothetical protein
LLGKRDRTRTTQEPAQNAEREQPPPLETQSNHLSIFRARRREQRNLCVEMLELPQKDLGNAERPSGAKARTF